MTRALGLLLLCLLTALPAAAAPVEVSAVPHLGQDAPACPGWASYLVRLRGTSVQSLSGTVEVTDGDGATTRAPFTTSGKERVALELPFHDAFGRGLEVIVRDAQGVVLTRAPASSPRACSPFLLDATPEARLALALRDERITPATQRLYSNASDGVALAVTAVLTDERTGELLLPAKAAAYASATVVAIRSTALLGLPDDRSAALSEWVRTGGTLAVIVARPEDLRHPRLATLIGSGVSSFGSDAAARFVEFEVVARPPAVPPAVDGGASVALMHHPGLALAPAVAIERIAPADAVRAALVGYSGGNVVPTRFGATAGHGLGEVHLLAFDPAASTFVDDPWVRRSMVDLVRHAWDRGTRVALVGGATPFDGGRLHAVRRLLDPNEAGSWGVGAAAVLLVLYSVLLIPMTFRRAARRNRPLSVLRELPLWSGVTLLLIVGIGAVAKGGRARARRVSVVECASGETRCGALHIRGLFASSSDSLDIATTSRAGLLDLADGSSDHSRTLMVARDGARLEELHGRPWETLVVREDSTTELPGTVSFLPDGKDVTLVNGLEHALVGVVARAPGGDFRYFARIPGGTSVKLSAGRGLGALSPILSPPGMGAPRPRPARGLEAYRFMAELDQAHPELGAAWSGIEPVARDGSDFWPERASALIAGVEGWGGAATDSGLAVEKSWTLLRVVGPEVGP